MKPFPLLAPLAALGLLLATASPALLAHDDLDDSRDELVDLSGRWRFSIGDDQRWAQPGFDDHNWSHVYVPGYWEEEGYRGYNGYAWYRRTFKFTEDPNQLTYLVIGQVDDSDEVYVNGRKVGGTGAFPPNYTSAWNIDRAYAIPPGTLQQGRSNVIAVRVYDGGSGGGIVGDSVGIYSEDLPLPEINLAGPWKFQAGDDPARSEPGFDDSKFDAIPVPSYWESSRGELDGFGWYRKTFVAQPRTDGATMVLMLGKIDDTDEVYLNGTKIGSTGNLNDSDRHSGVGYYDQNRGYFFPASLLKSENVIAVRVHDHGGRGGIYEGPIGVISQERYAEYWERARHHPHSHRRFLRLLSHVGYRP